MTAAGDDAERERLAEDLRRVHNWRRWGPYLAERPWGTVREDDPATGVFERGDWGMTAEYRAAEDLERRLVSLFLSDARAAATRSAA